MFGKMKIEVWLPVGAVLFVGCFDFQVNEQCHEFDECGLLAPFTLADKPIWNAGYVATEAEAETLASSIFGDSVERDLRTLILPLDLDDEFRVDCDQ